MSRAPGIAALEIAAYELLSRIAARAGDTETVETAQQIRAEEDAPAGAVPQYVQLWREDLNHESAGS